MNAKIPKQKYISFDIFDTLLKRSVACPKDIFCFMEKLHGKELHLPSKFDEVRTDAEKNEFEKLRKQPTLEQIYDRLQETHGEAALTWKQLELQMEYDGIRPNPPCVELLNRCVQGGKTVILISDMYLSSDFIRKMLEKCGITGYKKIYVSCETGCDKFDGGLFQFVLEDLGIRPWQLCHFGDSKRADILSPHSLGIHCRYVQKQQKQLCKKPDFVSNESALTYRTLRAVAANCCTAESSELGRQGCEILGPLLAGYTAWLVQQLKRDGIEDVYFLSRDGYMLMRAFDLLQINDIRSHYLYASRRSYVVPLLWLHPEFSAVADRIGRTDRISLAMFLTKLDLDPATYRKQAEDRNLDIDKVYEHGLFWGNGEIEQFYADIQEDVVCHSRESYEALVVYLKGLNLSGKIAVADVGYAGTIQYALQQVLDLAQIKVQVKGYYLGVQPAASLLRDGLIWMNGYLHTAGKNENYFDIIHVGILLYELQFYKAQGSVMRFMQKNGYAEPVFDKFEYDVESGKTMDEEAMMEQYQEGALKFIRELNCAFGQQLLDIEPDAALFNWLRLGWNPALREAKLWGDFRVSNTELQVLACPQSIFFYLLHPSTLRKDFLMSPWKIGFLKRLLKVPLPYARIYLFLKRKYQKQK